MKNQLAQMIGFLVLGMVVSATVQAEAAAPPAEPEFMQTTALMYGGATQSSGLCNVFNAGNQETTLVDFHAEDGQGHSFTAKNADACTNQTLASLRSCSITFNLSGKDSAVCVVKIIPAKQPKPGDQRNGHPPRPSLPLLTLELLDKEGKVLVTATGAQMPPPPPRNAGMPHQDGMQPQREEGVPLPPPQEGMPPRSDTTSPRR